MESILDDIFGIGPSKKDALLKTFGSIQGLKRASLEEIQEVKGISKNLAEKIYIFFRQDHYQPFSKK
jgi:excinuclease ABC subunit C